MKSSFQIKLKQKKKKTHKGDHMITFQFREKPFIHKRPEQGKHRIFRFNIWSSISQITWGFLRERERANLGFDETCLTFEGLTMALGELIREVEDWSKTEKIAKNKNNNPRPDIEIDIVVAWILMHKSR